MQFNDSYDARSEIIQNGALKFNADNTVDLRCSAVNSRMILVRDDGHVDQRSPALKNGMLRIKPTQIPENSDRRAFTDSEIETAWDKAQTIPDKDPTLYRVDKVGNIIFRHSYGKDTIMGWTIDHSKPLHENGTYHPNNLQVMQTSQNKSKNAKYPYNYNQAKPKGLTNDRNK